MKITVCLMLSILFLSLESNFIQAQSCPPCYKNITPLVGHGTTGGRRIINIHIDASWNIDSSGNPTPNQTNGNVWNAVWGCQGCPISAVDMWNWTLNTFGQYSRYYLDVVQNNPNVADIKIVCETDCSRISGGCADLDLATYPRMMRLCHSYKNKPVNQIAAVVAHEVGMLWGLLIHRLNRLYAVVALILLCEGKLIV
jgi:hypothetical protein